MLAFALAILLPIQQQDYPPAFPRTNATQLLETDRFVVWDIVWPQGQPTAMHRHLHDQVGTYYQRGGRHITNLDGTARDAMTAVASLSSTRKGTTHIEEGTTDPPLRAVFIELKKDAAPGAANPNAAPPPFLPRDGAKNVLDEERVAVWDVTWPATATGRSTLTRDTVVVWLSDGKISTVGANGPQETTVAAGRMQYLPAGSSRDFTVIGQPRAMVFEFK